MVIEETAEATAARGVFLADADLVGFMKTKGWKHCIVDKDVKDKDGNPPKDLAPYLDRAKTKKLPQVYLVDQAGKVRHEGDLPTTPAELLALLKQIGGQ